MRTVLFKQLPMVAMLVCVAATAVGQRHDWTVLADGRRYADIVAAAAAMTRADSADFNTVHALGRAYEGLLRHHEATRAFRHCYAMDSTRTDVAAAIARNAAQTGRTADAERFYRIAWAADTTDFDINYQLARLYMQTDRNPEAMQTIRRLLANDPSHPVLLRMLGDCYQREGESLIAAAYYDRSFTLNPENASLAVMLVNLWLQLDNPTNARSVCDTALSRHPAHRALRQCRATVFFTLRQYAEADTLYSRLMAEGDSSYRTLKFGGIARFYAGRFLDAVDPLRLAYERDTTAADVCALLGAALGRTGDRPEAFALFDRAEQLLQPNPLMTDLVAQLRAETLVRDNKDAQAFAIYWDLWKKRGRLNHLHAIRHHYTVYDYSMQKNDEFRRRSLFIHLLLADEYLKRGRNPGMQAYLRTQLVKTREWMFISGMKTADQQSPDGTRSTVTLERLTSVIERLPTSPPSPGSDTEDEAEEVNVY